MIISDKKIELQLLSITRHFLNELNLKRFAIAFTLETSLENTLNIGSLEKAELLTRIEKYFDITLPEGLLGQATKLQELVSFIQQSKPKSQLSNNAFSHASQALYVNPAHARTLVDLLFDYAQMEPDRIYLNFRDESGNEKSFTYGELQQQAIQVANGLYQLGIQSDDVVVIMLPTDATFFSAFFGVLLNGCIPAPICDQANETNQLQDHHLHQLKASCLITTNTTKAQEKLLKDRIPTLKKITTINELHHGDSQSPNINITKNHIALIQYRLDSAGTLKAISFTNDHFLHKIRDYSKAIHLKNTDVCVNCMPLYCHTGLMICLIAFYHGIPLVLLSPIAFLNNPEHWLWAIHYHRATVTVSPAFGFELCMRKMSVSDIEGLDISTCRIIIHDKKLIRLSTLNRFYKKLSSCGLQYAALFSAENTSEKIYHNDWNHITEFFNISFFTKVYQKIIHTFFRILRIFYAGYVIVILALHFPFLYITLIALSKRLARRCARFIARSIFFLCGIPLKIKGNNYFSISQPCIFVSNHASYIDAAVLIACLPTTTTLVAKKELLRTPILSMIMRQCDYLTINREDFSKSQSDVALLQERLAAGESLALFPEGTFTHADGLLPFKLGAFKIAVETKTAILPISLRNTRKILRANTWLPRIKTIHVTVGKPIQVNKNDWDEITRLQKLSKLFIQSQCDEKSLL